MRFRLALAVIVLAGLHVEAAAQGLWFWCETARAYYPYVTTCPVPWRPVPPRPYAPMLQPVPGAQPTPLSSSPPTPVVEPTDAYRQGVADWRALEAWFASQSGDRRAGADFWAANRSKVGHPTCADAGENFAGNKTAFITGCQEAKRQLDPIDAKRLSDPQYRAGFNEGAEQLPLSASAAPPPRQNSSTAPTPSVSFSSFPISETVYVGPHIAPDLSAPENKLFRTRITAASQENPNFAGRYVIETWGCGTGCAQGVAVNVATGKVIWLPGSFVLEPLDSERFEYRLDSRLLIVNGHESEDDETPYAPRCYVLDDDTYPRLSKQDCAVSVSTTASTSPPSTTIAPAPSPAPMPKEGYGGYVQNMRTPRTAVTTPTTEPPAPIAATSSSTQPSAAGTGIAGGVVLLVLVVLAGYFLPTIIAAARHHHNAGAIFVLNLFLGWTFLGWVLALVWSATAVRRPVPGSG